MNWLKKIVIKWVRDDWNNVSMTEEPRVARMGKGLSIDSDGLGGEPIRFNVITARGGIVVTTRTYNKQRDRNEEVIHVIHDDEDVAKKVGEIVALELMKA